MRRCYNFVKRREQSNACARKSYRFTIALLLSASEVLRLASVQQSLAIFCSANVGSILSAFDGACLRVASTECYSDGEGVGDSTATFPSGTGAAAPDIHFSREEIPCGGRNLSSRSSK